MTEIAITSNKTNHLIDPLLHIWGWEVPVYLFLGGLAAGLILIAAWAHIYHKQASHPTAHSKVALWGPIFLSFGMLALFLDLENKINVLRFYGTFAWTSPMSWGSWILMLYYPLSLLLALSTIEAAYPKLAALIKKIPLGKPLVELSKKHHIKIALFSIPVGLALGVYTGVLLSAYVARPFWNSSLLGILFLVSGLSSALAFVLLLSKQKAEQLFFIKIDMYVLIIEIALIALFIVGLSTSTEIHLQSLNMIMGGKYTLSFWLWFVSLGVILPLVLEKFELKGLHIPKLVTPLLVLYGGLIFRFVMVSVGQQSTWIPY